MKYMKEDEVNMVKFLRYRTHDPTSCHHTYMPMKTIAKFLNKSISHVFRICQHLRKSPIAAKTMQKFMIT